MPGLTTGGHSEAKPVSALVKGDCVMSHGLPAPHALHVAASYLSLAFWIASSVF